MSEPIYRTLANGEREAFLDLVEAAFGERALFDLYFESDPRLGYDDTLVCDVDGRLAACVQIFTREIRLRSERVLLGGIGSVATHPDLERRGYATALLRRAIDEMVRRGMALSLLFTGRTSFYERLGWVSVPSRGWAVHAGSGSRVGQRRFQPDDLPVVRALYDDYARDFESVTVRDDAYWNAQLRFACAGAAGGEDFRLALRGDVPVAYVRKVEVQVPWAMEFARRADAAPELAALLVDVAPRGSALICARTPDAELAAELARVADRVDAIEIPDAMWRVLDRRRLLGLADLPGDPPDAELLPSLVAGERSVYWASDRF